LLITAGAIACSALTILSCDFFVLSSSTTQNVLDVTTSTGIGLFSFEEDPTLVNESTIVVNGAICQPYSSEGKFWDSNDWMNTMWVIAQYSSLVAPLLAACAWLMSLAELLFGRFRGSFILPIILFLLACFVQGATFFMYGQLDVCHRDTEIDSGDQVFAISNSCQLSFGAFLSIAAGFSYYLASILLCCFPRPNRCCCGNDDTTKTSEREELLLTRNRHHHQQQSKTLGSSSETSSSGADEENSPPPPPQPQHDDDEMTTSDSTPLQQYHPW
jgi:hypothetical protein